MDQTASGNNRASGSSGAGRPRRRRIWPWILGVFAVAIILLVALWDWDWFIPLVDSRASSALGHKVTMQHLHVRLGRTTVVTADGVRVDNPEGFPADQPLAQIDHLGISVAVMSYIRNQVIDIPLINVDHPVIDALAHQDGSANWTMKSQSGSSSSSASKPPRLGLLRIHDGHVHVVDPKLRTDMNLQVHTAGYRDPDGGHIVVTADGTYAHQPITGRFIGGALLTLQDRGRPYPVDLHVANGPTHVSLEGEIDQPLTFGGARLKLVFTGPDMALLLPLTGVPIPHTPPFKVTGNLDYQNRRIVFDKFHGTVGSSDLEGRIAGDAQSKVPDIKADLSSQRVDLNDLAGFIGGTPGTAKTGNVQQKQEIAASKTSGNILPDQKFSVPKLRAANVHLTYRGEHIENKYVPLDNIVVAMDIVDGHITLHPLDFKVGTGSIDSNLDLQPSGEDLRTKADVKFRHVDLSRILQATHAFHGDGVLGGQADITTTGSSVASMLGNGNGGVTMVISGNGDISALLHDIAGLEVGNAILSALGLPNRASLRCFIADMPLHDGILSMKTFLLQTSEARSIGRGTIDLKNQTLDYSLTTRSSHFSIGSLPGPINVTGKLGSPSIRPGAEVVARAGAAVGLGVLLVPLAILPTIQLGVGEGACTDALQKTEAAPAAPPPAAVPVHRRHGPQRKAG
ncbi:AsmA family protein [Lichenicoccus roseus]|uniref:AsmA family protein n=1 Tax=Lichenicoccus roseus TaxID=2683649 RepID=UPI001F102389|nr:AsmA family protein [Lichenicoccus roseus]